MKYLLILAIALTFIERSYAQEYAYQPALQEQLLFGPIESPLDSSVQIPKRRLLPTNMHFVERTLWDEDGLFRKMGLASPLTPEVRKSELGLRRSMLTAHQIGGFVTLGCMISAAYFGQLVLDGNRGYRTNHQIFVTATIISYSTTGLLAVLTPPPLIRRDEVSTTTIHKALAWVHFAGMVLTPILGASIQHASTTDIARFHQASAYITTAALAASLITITF
jgi:hypothetical protein